MQHFHQKFMIVNPNQKKMESRSKSIEREFTVRWCVFFIKYYLIFKFIYFSTIYFFLLPNLGIVISKLTSPMCNILSNWCPLWRSIQIPYVFQVCCKYSLGDIGPLIFCNFFHPYLFIPQTFMFTLHPLFWLSTIFNLYISSKHYLVGLYISLLLYSFN